MATRVADTIEPMGTATFPVATGANIELTKHDGTTKGRLQAMYDAGELGGLPTPTAAEKMLIAKSSAGTLAWTEVDADNDELGNSAGYQNSTQVNTAITTALTAYTPTSELATVATSGSYSDLSNKPTNVSSFANDSGYQNETQVRNLISAINPFTVNGPYDSVSELPATGAVHNLYLVRKTSGSGQNLCDEYIWIVDTSTGHSSHYELIGDTAVELIAQNVQYTNATTASANNVKLALDDVYTKIDSAEASILPQIKTFTMSTSADHEVGETVSSVTFNWSYNKAVASQTLTDCTLSDTSVRTATYDTALTATKTFTLSATDSHSQSDTKDLSINFLHKVYYGSAAVQSTYDSAFILGLSNKELKSNYYGTYHMTIATGEYGFIAAPASFSMPSSCEIGGILTDLDATIGTIQFTNASGNTTEFKIYKTTQAALGSISMIFE